MKTKPTPPKENKYGYTHGVYKCEFCGYKDFEDTRCMRCGRFIGEKRSYNAGHK